jgi:cystathionine beta-lyase
MFTEFDVVVDRRGSDSEKWSAYGEDVIPLWVADMDFRAPAPVLIALHRRLEHGVLGYPHEPDSLREMVAQRMMKRYGWSVSPEACIPIPGVIPGFNVACRALAQQGDAALVFPPVYSPILSAPAQAGLERTDVELVRGADLQYRVDLDGLSAAMTPRTRLILLCNPHNPVGRAFSANELAQIADCCLANDVLICADEIHSDLIFSDCRHTPIASLAPEVEARTVTLIAPSKTYNIPGLKIAFAIIPNAGLRKRFQATRSGLVTEPNLLAMVAAEAAYGAGDEWLTDCLSYLEANRDYLMEFIAERMPGIRAIAPEATYLAWLDCSGLGLAQGAYRFFLEQARVALSDGPIYGRGGAGFVRLNFGCPRSTLAAGLERMAAALAALAARPAG